MTAQRSTKEEKLYKKIKIIQKNNQCPFCIIDIHHEQFVEETENFKIIRNYLPYSIWEGQGVVDHLMIVPKEHTDSLGSLSKETAHEYIKLIDKFVPNGYNIYARASNSKTKSIFHQHTHLIKLDNKDRKIIILLRKPFYLRLSR